MTPLSPPQLALAVRRLHGLGWVDSQIAGAARVSRWTIGRHRRRLGLPSNRGSAKHSQVLSASLRRWLKEIASPSLARLRHDMARVEVARQGWPLGASPRQAAILLALRGGPLTVAELRAALRTRPSRWGACLYIATRALVRRGWLARGWRTRGGKRERIYRLARAVLAVRRSWEAGRRG